MKNLSYFLIATSIISLLQAGDMTSQITTAPAIPAATTQTQAGAASTTVTAAGTVPAAATKPPMPPSPSAQAAQTTEAAQTIYDIISTNPNLTTLSALLSAADLTDTLSKGNFTIFAPTDAAFNSLPLGTVEALMKPENRSKLLMLILYHLLPVALPTSQMKPGGVETANGRSLQILPAAGAIKVDQAVIKTPDIKASNGYVNVIDTVLTP